MTISYKGSGIFSSSAASGNNISIPGGASYSADDLALIFVGHKPYTSTVSLGALYTELSTATSGIVANGNGSGSTRTTSFERVMPNSSSTTAVYTLTSPSPVMGQALRFGIDPGNSWNTYACKLTDGDDTGTAVSGYTGNAGAAPPNGSFVSGDWIAIAVTIKDDAPNHTSQSLSIAGCTVGTITWLAKNSTTSGNDGAMYLGYAQITDGSSTGHVTYTATSSVSGASTVSGNVVRLREVLPPFAAFGIPL